MGSTNKFWKGILFGALAGGAISLLDRETRKSVMENCKKTAGNITYYVKHPNEVGEQLKEKTEKLRMTVEQVSEDVSFIAEKVEELREIIPSVAGIVKDTKEAFVKPDSEKRTLNNIER